SQPATAMLNEILQAIPNIIAAGLILLVAYIVSRFVGRLVAEFSVLKPDNATGNFTKVVQRIAVRITIDPNQEGMEHLRPGMS
ncbi:mechanosensitive ion channel family protein, partial [Acinetobacter baumannii]|uniref:mechanosensitive ion channel family protein n=1 Tax=Acinetobacter baumannii TaxID=470 RepID=UPI0038CD637B